MFRKTVLCLLAILPLLTFVTRGQDSNYVPFRDQLKLNPSNWLQRSQNAVLMFEGNLGMGADTAFMNESFPRMRKDFDMISNDFAGHGAVMRIRALDDVKANLLQQLNQLDKWRNQIRKHNDVLASNYMEISRMNTDSVKHLLATDSVLRSIYAEEINFLYQNIRRVETSYQDNLRKTVLIENKLNQTNLEISRLIMAVEKELGKRNDALFRRTHKPLWEVTPSTYSSNIVDVFKDTVKQNLASLTYYAKNAYARMILFRLLLLLITLLPIWYFRKLRKNLDYKDEHGKFHFVHKYTGAATSSFILVMAPLIFVNSPHIFTEAIMVTLAFTTSMIFLKEHPGIPRWTLYAILGTYVLLKVLNLMVSVTFFGRMIWACSIIALIPILYFIKSLRSQGMQNRWLFQTIAGLTTLMFILGWMLNITGHYPLGRIILLTGLEQLFLAIVLYVAVYSFIDFIGILADLYNSSNRVTVVKVDLIYNKLLNLVRILAIIFWFYSLVVNINATSFLQQNVFGILRHQITVGNHSFTPGSILIFFIVLILSFHLSRLLDGLFIDEKRTLNSEGKTSLGSIILMLRLFIISLGFVGGMLIAGIPFNDLTLFVSAMGVGIGFGLQSVIANMISGMIIAFEKPIYVGDIIELEGGNRGKVTDIGIRATKVDTADGAEYIIPNGDIVGKVLKNWTLTTRYYKIETTIKVDHANNAEMVSEIILDTLNETDFLMPYPKPKVDLREITPQGMQYKLSCWIHNIVDESRYKSELLTRIHKALAEAGVSYPKKNNDD